MRFLFLSIFFFFGWTTQVLAVCSKDDVCKMLNKKMGHFDILNQCPNAGPLLKECRKVSKNKLKSLLPPQFVANDNGTITDTSNKLMWIKTGILKKHSLKTAKQFAEGYSLDEIVGWRVPTLPELKTLLYSKRVKNSSGQKSWIHPLFDDGRGHYYWSSTTCEEVSEIEDRYQKKICQQGPGGAWLIHFNLGAIFWHYVDNEHYFVWLVRNLE